MKFTLTGEGINNGSLQTTTTKGKTMKKTVTVFGGGSSSQKNKEIARKLGIELAQNGFNVKTGGYGGVMEAISKGVTSVTGGVAIGITLKDKPIGNSFLTRTIVAKGRTIEMQFARRLGLLLESDAYIFFGGDLGVLVEMAAVFNLQKKGKLLKIKPKRILFINDSNDWKEVLFLCFNNDLRCVITKFEDAVYNLNAIKPKLVSKDKLPCCNLRRNKK
jgi:uncharacterized protein (TIGR00725 family)